MISPGILLIVELSNAYPLFPRTSPYHRDPFVDTLTVNRTRPVAVSNFDVYEILREPPRYLPFARTRRANAVPPQPPPVDLELASLPRPAPRAISAPARRAPWLVGQLGAVRPRRPRRRRLRTWER